MPITTKKGSHIEMGDLDNFVDNLQEQIFSEAREAYGEKGFQRWRNPRYHGRMTTPDAHARITGKCGDTMEIYLKFKNDVVSEASYFTDGCASSSICGSFAAELTLGKDPDALAEINGDVVLNKIGCLPKKDMHCADLAAETVQEALAGYMTCLRAKDGTSQKTVANESTAYECEDLAVTIPCELADRIRKYGEKTATDLNSVMIEALDTFLRETKQ